MNGPSVAAAVRAGVRRRTVLAFDVDSNSSPLMILLPAALLKATCAASWHRELVRGHRVPAHFVAVDQDHELRHASSHHLEPGWAAYPYDEPCGQQIDICDTTNFCQSVKNLTAAPGSRSADSHGDFSPDFSEARRLAWRTLSTTSRSAPPTQQRRPPFTQGSSRGEIGPPEGPANTPWCKVAKAVSGIPPIWAAPTRPFLRSGRRCAGLHRSSRGPRSDRCNPVHRQRADPLRRPRRPHGQPLRHLAPKGRVTPAPAAGRRSAGRADDVDVLDGPLDDLHYHWLAGHPVHGPSHPVLARLEFEVPKQVRARRCRSRGPQRWRHRLSGHVGALEPGPAIEVRVL